MTAGEGSGPMSPSTALRRIGGAGGRGFHNFNVVYRDEPSAVVVAFTAARIPAIAGRRSTRASRPAVRDRPPACRIPEGLSTPTQPRLGTALPSRRGDGHSARGSVHNTRIVPSPKAAANTVGK